MIINGSRLLSYSPILPMVDSKKSAPGGTSYGLGEAGYDIRIKQTIRFYHDGQKRKVAIDHPKSQEMPYGNFVQESGRFCLASTMEKFRMPGELVGVVHDKSTWARRGLSVFNTVIEPGWEGYLTLELVYHGEGELIIPAGAGIAQVLFTQCSMPRYYSGKYQNQADGPVAAIDTPVDVHLTIPGSGGW